MSKDYTDVCAPRLGCHLSLGLKPLASLRAAREHGAECAQIFASSPGAWKPPLEDGGRERACIQGLHENDIDPLFVHAVYLINLASSDPHLAARSRDSLRATLHSAKRLGARGLVTHIGSHGGRGFEAVAQDTADALLEVLEPDSGVSLIIENSAGSGAIIGSNLSELAELISRAGEHPDLWVALDVAHLCGSGWDFTQVGEAARLVRHIEETIGMDRLALIHANDSKVPPGSRRDRHANIGDGYVGTEGFRSLLAQPEFRSVPWLLETPDLDIRLPDGDRFKSLSVLHALRSELYAT